MLAQVYQYEGNVTRSVVRATLVAEIEIDEIPKDQAEFAHYYGGDFIEILSDALVG